MMRPVLNLVCALVATMVASCTDTESATDLHPEGPPMIQQVRMREKVLVSGSAVTRDVFAFGTHPMAPDSIVHPVSSAGAIGQQLRVVVDELLVGNYIEEINCRAVVDDDAYDRVPLGATPDDVVACAAVKDILPATCTGSHAMCLCKLPGGCVEL